MSLRGLVASAATGILYLSLALYPTAAAQKLVPRRAVDLVEDNARRDLEGFNVFLPTRKVAFEYSRDIFRTPTAIVAFDASRTYPMISVDAFNDLLDSIHCDPNGGIDAGISMTFTSRDAVITAAETWNSYHQFHVVTSHAGCNLAEELGAWRVHAIETSVTSQRIKLFAEKISLNQLGSYDISIFGHELSGVWRPQAHEQTFDRRMTFEPTLSKNLSGSDILSVDTSNLPADLGSKVANSKLDIQCTECSFNFNFTVDVNASVSDFNITALSISTTVNSFDQSVLLGVSVGAGPVSFSHLRDLFNLPLTPLEIRDLFNFGPEVGVAAEIDLDISAAIQFSVGAKSSIAPGTFATFDFLSQTESDNGWDTAKINSIPMKIQGGQLNTTLTASISPFVGIGITLPINTGQPLVEVRISQNAPTVVLASTMTTDVNRNCEPIGANDFESFATAYQITADLEFGTHIGLVGNVADVLPPWDTVFPHGDFTLLNHTGSLSSGNKTCFVVVDDNPASTSPPSTAINNAEIGLQTPAPTGTLLEAASAVPTFDVPKIVSYFSANGHLPTNVNYAQLAQATTVPDSIKVPVQKAAQGQTKTSDASARTSSGILYVASCILLIFSSIF